MSGTGVIGCLAVIVAATFVDAVTMNQVCLGNRTFPVVFGVTADITTGLGWHGDKTLALATGMSGAGIIGCLAVIVTTAGVDTITMDQVCLVSGC